MEAAAAEAKPALPPPEPHVSTPPPSFVPLPADFASRPSPGPVDLSYTLPETARPAAPPPLVAEAPSLAPPPAPTPARASSSGTLAALLHDMAQTDARPGWPAATPQTGLLPAGMVTLPLAEVMRLVGGVQTELASPFAALRIAGGSSGAR